MRFYYDPIVGLVWTGSEPLPPLKRKYRRKNAKKAHPKPYSPKRGDY